MRTYQAELNNLITKCVDDIWLEYDKDCNGSLDKQETRRFMDDIFKEMGEEDAHFTDDEFNQYFKEFDQDNSGTIDKEEMSMFIKAITGIS